MIKQKVLDLREEFVPKIIISNKPKWKFEFPISLDLRKLIKDKNKAHRVWVAHRQYDNSETFRLKYVKLRNRCQQQCRKAKRKYEKGIAEQVKSQPKAFWKFANQKLKTKSCVAPLLANPENPHSLCHDEKDKAEILQKQFVSVHTKEPFGPTPEPPSHILDSYHICGEVLEHVDVENDLGVTIDSALKFEQHILNKIKIANSMMGLIRRVFSYLSPEIFKPLYSALVRSHLEYAQAVWSPRYKRMQDMIEQVQIRATKQVNGLQHLDYPERLKLLNLPTLKYRRHRGDMIETWKHFNTYEEQLLPPSFTPRDRPSRRHRRQLYQHRPEDGVYGVQRNSFYFRTTSIWNQLPAEVIEATTLNTFKNRLDSFWERQRFKFDPAEPLPQSTLSQQL
ncbi:hypothetical protein Pcinc_015314 [Petrolisthes cinctipes]|uniref:Uncharacterized protein n=1 Tax=Petrolisthes cinctipes TaxID=88211 RepID=A0AAE1FTA1_PETCI|nr:hypothetical protein Pcinc_015314 [Petrolisthes cinctipes]